MLQYLFSTLLFVFAVSAVHAQKLPQTSREVFRCEVEGRTVYSDSPCMGAKKINVEPTRGLNKSTGKEMIGKDVRTEKQQEAFADAVRPITGLNAKQLDAQRRRFKLTSEQQTQCRQLDVQIPIAEKQEKNTNLNELSVVQAQLLRMRSTFRELGC